jgi:hypothetical protein
MHELVRAFARGGSMGDFNVISNISETIRDLLIDGLRDLSAEADIHDLQGAISTSPARVTIFLYDVCEDPSARNAPRITKQAPPDVIVKKPPAALLLRYMLTPWGGSRDTEQRILGRVMQILYEDAILSGSQLRGALAGTDEAIRVMLAPISLEDRARVWHSVQKPYRLSVTYEVRVARIEVVREQRVKPVLDRRLGPATVEERP